MEPTLSIGQRVLVEPHRHDASANPTSARSPSSTRPKAPSRRCAARLPHVVRLGGEAPAMRPIPQGVRASTSSSASSPARATRSRSSKATSIRNRASDVRESRTPTSAVCRARSPECNFPTPITDSRRALVHDGRQPWRIRRQQVLGTRPHRMDHRRSLRHLLAARQDRDPLGPLRPPARPHSAPDSRARRRTRRAAAGSACSPSTGASGAARSPAPTRPGAAAWPGRWSPPAVLFDYRRSARASCARSSALNDSKQHTPEAREELYPLVLRAAARVVVVSRCVRGIDARGLHKTNLAALRDAVIGVSCGRQRRGALPDRRLRRARLRAPAARDRRRRRHQRRDRGRVDRREGDPGPVHAAAPTCATPAGASASTWATPRPPTARRSCGSGVSPLHRMSFQSLAYQQLAL